jgi:hypothetical protein
MHVHGDRFDRIALLGRHRCETLRKSLATAAVGNVQHSAIVEIANHRDEFASLKRLLIHAQHRRCHGVAARQTALDGALDGALHDAVSFTPGETELPSSGGTSGLLHPVDHHALEKSGEAAARLGPRNRDLFDAMLGAGAAWHVRSEDGFELAGVEMSPATGLGVWSK